MKLHLTAKCLAGTLVCVASKGVLMNQTQDEASAVSESMVSVSRENILRVSALGRMGDDAQTKFQAFLAQVEEVIPDIRETAGGGTKWSVEFAPNGKSIAFFKRLARGSDRQTVLWPDWSSPAGHFVVDNATWRGFACDEFALINDGGLTIVPIDRSDGRVRVGHDTVDLDVTADGRWVGGRTDGRVILGTLADPTTESLALGGERVGPIEAIKWTTDGEFILVGLRSSETVVLSKDGSTEVGRVPGRLLSYRGAMSESRFFILTEGELRLFEAREHESVESLIEVSTGLPRKCQVLTVSPSRKRMEVRVWLEDHPLAGAQEIRIYELRDRGEPMLLSTTMSVSVGWIRW